MAALDPVFSGRIGRPSLRDTAAQFLTSLNDALVRFAMRAETAQMLRGLTERQLADIGIERADIDRVTTRANTLY